MANLSELDLFIRSVSGDWWARTQLYEKYVFGSKRVTRLATGSSSLDDFRHDCLTNLLHTGDSWDKEGNLSSWIESVAAWTALGDERRRDMQIRRSQAEIRMCAEIEGDKFAHRSVIAAYAPPVAGPDDLPLHRLAAAMSDTEKAIFLKVVVENRTFIEAATVVGRQPTAVGPIFARLISNMARIFGAPPIMEEDLIPVVSRLAEDPSRPVGRAKSIELDTAFYSLTPHMRAIGLTTAYEARILTLWEQMAAPSIDLQHHLDNCNYCADVHRSLQLMFRALSIPLGTEFRLCPGAFTLATIPDMEREAFDQHLTQCAICQEERTLLLDGHGTRQAKSASQTHGAKLGSRSILWALIGVALLVVAGFIGGHHYIVARKSPDVDLGNQTTVVGSERYQGLAQEVAVDDPAVLAMILPKNRVLIGAALGRVSTGYQSAALAISARVAQENSDPGAQVVYAMSLLKAGMLTDAYREMLKAESMEPRESLRCWIMLQFALNVADGMIIEREVQDLSRDPNYRTKSEQILARVRERE